MTQNKLSILLLVPVLLVASLVAAQDAPNPKPNKTPAEPLANSVKSLVTRARALNERLKRQPEPDSQRRILAEQAATLKGWLDGQSWMFSTKVQEVTANDGIYTLRADCPLELAGYSRNDAAFQKGGIYSYSIEVAVPEVAKDMFHSGDNVTISGTIKAMFGNDVPIRKPDDPTIVLFDLCLPPAEKDAVARIEVSMVNSTLSGTNFDLELTTPASPAAPPMVPPAGRKPPLESTLQELQARIEKLVSEARRQKNTALVTDILAKHEEDIRNWLEGQEWEFTTTAIDVVADNEILLHAALPRALQRFAMNTKAIRSGGLFSDAPNVAIDRDLAETIGRGDTVQYRGTVMVEQLAYAGASRQDRKQFGNDPNILLFTLYLPPLDQQQPLGMRVLLRGVEITKVAEAKRKDEVKTAPAKRRGGK